MTSIPTPSGTNRSGSRLPISTPVSQNTSMLRPPSVLPLGKPSIVGSKRLRGSDGAEEAVSGAPKRPREALKRSNYAFWFIFSRFPCISLKFSFLASSFYSVNLTFFHCRAWRSSFPKFFISFLPLQIPKPELNLPASQRPTKPVLNQNFPQIFRAYYQTELARL